VCPYGDRWSRKALIRGSVLRTPNYAQTNASEYTLAVALRWRLTVFGWLKITHRCYEQICLSVGDRYSSTVECSLRLTDSLWSAIRCAIALNVYLRTDLLCSLLRKDSSGERVYTLAAEIPSMVIRYSLGGDKCLHEKLVDWWLVVGRVLDRCAVWTRRLIWWACLACRWFAITDGLDLFAKLTFRVLTVFSLVVKRCQVLSDSSWVGIMCFIDVLLGLGGWLSELV